MLHSPYFRDDFYYDPRREFLLFGHPNIRITGNPEYDRLLYMTMFSGPAFWFVLPLTTTWILSDLFVRKVLARIEYRINHSELRRLIENEDDSKVFLSYLKSYRNFSRIKTANEQILLTKEISKTFRSLTTEKFFKSLDSTRFYSTTRELLRFYSTREIDSKLLSLTKDERFTVSELDQMNEILSRLSEIESFLRSLDQAERNRIFLLSRKFLKQSKKLDYFQFRSSSELTEAEKASLRQLEEKFDKRNIKILLQFLSKVDQEKFETSSLVDSFTDIELRIFLEHERSRINQILEEYEKTKEKLLASNDEREIEKAQKTLQYLEKSFMSFIFFDDYLKEKSRISISPVDYFCSVRRERIASLMNERSIFLRASSNFFVYRPRIKIGNLSLAENVRLFYVSRDSLLKELSRSEDINELKLFFKVYNLRRISKINLLKETVREINRSERPIKNIEDVLSKSLNEKVLAKSETELEEIIDKVFSRKDVKEKKLSTKEIQSLIDQELKKRLEAFSVSLTTTARSKAPLIKKTLELFFNSELKKDTAYKKLFKDSAVLSKSELSEFIYDQIKKEKLIGDEKNSIIFKIEDSIKALEILNLRPILDSRLTKEIKVDFEKVLRKDIEKLSFLSKDAQERILSLKKEFIFSKTENLSESSKLSVYLRTNLKEKIYSSIIVEIMKDLEKEKKKTFDRSNFSLSSKFFDLEKSKTSVLNFIKKEFSVTDDAEAARIFSRYMKKVLKKSESELNYSAFLVRSFFEKDEILKSETFSKTEEINDFRFRPSETELFEVEKSLRSVQRKLSKLEKEAATSDEYLENAESILREAERLLLDRSSAVAQYETSLSSKVFQDRIRNRLEFEFDQEFSKIKNLDFDFLIEQTESLNKKRNFLLKSIENSLAIRGKSFFADRVQYELKTLLDTFLLDEKKNFHQLRIDFFDLKKNDFVSRTVEDLYLKDKDLLFSILSKGFEIYRNYLDLIDEKKNEFMKHEYDYKGYEKLLKFSQSEFYRMLSKSFKVDDYEFEMRNVYRLIEAYFHVQSIELKRVDADIRAQIADAALRGEFSFEEARKIYERDNFDSRLITAINETRDESEMPSINFLARGSFLLEKKPLTSESEKIFSDSEKEESFRSLVRDQQLFSRGNEYFRSEIDPTIFEIAKEFRSYGGRFDEFASINVNFNFIRSLVEEKHNQYKLFRKPLFLFHAADETINLIEDSLFSKNKLDRIENSRALSKKIPQILYERINYERAQLKPKPSKAEIESSKLKKMRQNEFLENSVFDFENSLSRVESLFNQERETLAAAQTKQRRSI